jgi:hypothetical protein
MQDEALPTLPVLHRTQDARDLVEKPDTDPAVFVGAEAVVADALAATTEPEVDVEREGPVVFVAANWRG